MPHAGVPSLLVDESFDPALVWPSTPTPTGCARMGHGFFCSGAAAFATGPSAMGAICPVQAPRVPLESQGVDGAAVARVRPGEAGQGCGARQDRHPRLLGRESLGRAAQEKPAAAVDEPPPPSPQTAPASAAACGDPQLQTMPLPLVGLMPVALPVQAPPAGMGGCAPRFGHCAGQAAAPPNMDTATVLAPASSSLGPAAQQLRLLRLDGVAEPRQTLRLLRLDGMAEPWQSQSAQLASADVVALEVRLPQASRGAVLHGAGGCRPCAWYWRPQGCSNGMDCCHCHMCPAGEVKARRKARMEVLRASGEHAGRSSNARSRRSHNLRISALI
mmetsp:Transcript_60322/g.188956  ORF Transcript_60322/g.188956 Transcript_60322/m.188956 type:complete len:331 (-) Transcript_60322:109-1101(-)